MSTTIINTSTQESVPSQVTEPNTVQTVVSNTETGGANIVEQSVSRGGSRSFKVKLEENGPLYGRYNGDSPYQAANKALSEIVRDKVKNGNIDDSEINFFLVESTKGSTKKQHQYVGRRIKLDVPIEYPVANGVTIKKEHKNFLRKVKRQNVRGLASTAPTLPDDVIQSVQVAGSTTVGVGEVAQPLVLSTQTTATSTTVNVLV